MRIILNQWPLVLAQTWLPNASSSASEAGWHAAGVFVSTWSSEADGSPQARSAQSAPASKGEPTTPANFFPRSPVNSWSAPQSKTSSTHTHRHALRISYMWKHSIHTIGTDSWPADRMDLSCAETPVYLIHEQLKAPEMRCTEFHSALAMALHDQDQSKGLLPWPPKSQDFPKKPLRRIWGNWLSLAFGNHIGFTLSNPPMFWGESFWTLPNSTVLDPWNLFSLRPWTTCVCGCFIPDSIICVYDI